MTILTNIMILMAGIAIGTFLTTLYVLSIVDKKEGKRK